MKSLGSIKEYQLQRRNRTLLDICADVYRDIFLLAGVNRITYYSRRVGTTHTLWTLATACLHRGWIICG